MRRSELETYKDMVRLLEAKYDDLFEQHCTLQENCAAHLRETITKTLDCQNEMGNAEVRKIKKSGIKPN